MPVNVSVPVTVLFESSGSRVVVPPGRGPFKTSITTGPLGVTWIVRSKVTPGHNTRFVAAADDVETETTATTTRRTVSRRRRKPRLTLAQPSETFPGLYRIRTAQQDMTFLYPESVMRHYSSRSM